MKNYYASVKTRYVDTLNQQGAWSTSSCRCVGDPNNHPGTLLTKGENKLSLLFEAMWAYIPIVTSIRVKFYETLNPGVFDEQTFPITQISN